jgi:RNA polymerase sigma-70 factor (ECF subfamily)
LARTRREPDVVTPPDNPSTLEAPVPDAVIQEHYVPVYRFLFTLSGRVEETQDLTQETFLRALSRLDSFRPGTKMRSWLLRIASNAFFYERRKRKRARLEPLHCEPTAEGTKVDYNLETAEQAALVRAAMEELSDLTRLVFHLRAQEDLSFREIAELAGTTEQAARWHMHQARTKLLARLGDQL